MKIYASIVLYENDPKILQATIESFLNTELDVKLYLIDNSKSDRLRLLALDPRVEYIFNNKNLGFGKAHNIALRKSIEHAIPYHLVLNPDVTYNRGVLEALVAYMQQHDDVALVMPKVYYPDGTLQYTCRKLPTPADLFLRRFLPQNLSFVEQMNAAYELHDFGYDTEMNIPFFLGSFLFLRTKHLSKVGLFDENIFLYMEDLDLCRRLHTHYKTIFYPDVSITHIHARDSYKKGSLLLAHIQSTIYYFNKWGWFFDRQRKEINRKLLENIANV